MNHSPSQDDESEALLQSPSPLGDGLRDMVPMVPTGAEQTEVGLRRQVGVTSSCASQREALVARAYSVAIAAK